MCTSTSAPSSERAREALSAAVQQFAASLAADAPCSEVTLASEQLRQAALRCTETDAGGTDAADHLQMACALSDLCHALSKPSSALYIASVDHPDESLLATICSHTGPSLEPPSASQQTALHAVSVGLWTLCTLGPSALTAIEPSETIIDSTVGQHTGHEAKAPRSSNSHQSRPHLLIEVLSSDDTQEQQGAAATVNTPTQEQLSQQHDTLLQGMLSVALTWLPDAGLPALWHMPTCQHTGVEGSVLQWPVQGASPAERLMQALSEAAASDTVPSAEAGAEQFAGTRYLAAHAGEIISAIRRSMTVGSHRSPDPQAAVLAAVEERVLAAWRLALLTRALQGEQLSAVLPAAIPAALTVAEDPRGVVCVYGLWTLQHMAEHAPTADLSWQADLLIDAAKRFLLVSQEGVWGPACVCSVELVTAVTGGDPRANGLHALMTQLLSEVERHGHKRERRYVFLGPQVLLRLIECMGLTTLRHTNRLLPLLLEWLQAYDSETRTGAARALYHLTRHTWPRSPAHAPALWHHLSALYVREAADTSPSSTSAHSAHSTATGSVGPSQTTEAARWALETCKMLGCVGGEALWQAVEQTRTQLGSMCDTGGHTSDGPVTAAAIAGMRPELHRALETLIAAVEAAQG